MRRTSLSLTLALACSWPGAAWAQFTDVATGKLADPGNSYGVSWGDYDGDGDPDLYVSDDGANLLLRNDPDRFRDVTAAPLDDAGNGSAAPWGDYDNDGRLDLYLVNYLSPNHLCRNMGAGVFADVTAAPLNVSGPGLGTAWVDVDRDGDLDLYVVHYGMPNHLFRNDGGGAFADAATGPLADVGWGYGAAWADYDNDGDPDVYLTNDGFNRLLRNDGGGVFVNVATGLPLIDSGVGSGASWGDCDNDGDLDLFIANFGTANKLLRNDGGGVFVNVTSGALGDLHDANGSAWADYDNDGDLDLYVANYGTSNLLLRNDGAGVFTNVAVGDAADAGLGTGVAWADYDGDGDLDLYLANEGANRLLRNDLASGNHWLELNLAGTVSNRSAIGARVTAVAGGARRTREVSGGSGYMSQNALTVHFGLGAATVVDTLIIRWPSGILERLFQVSTNQRIAVVEQAGVAVADQGDLGGPARMFLPAPNPFHGSVRLRYVLPAAAPARLQIFDLQGRVVATLADGSSPAGTRDVRWSGADDRGRPLPAGLYVVRFESGDVIARQKLILSR